MRVGVYWAHQILTGSMSERSLVESLKRDNSHKLDLIFYGPSSESGNLLTQLKKAMERLASDEVDFALYIHRGVPLSLKKLQILFKEFEQSGASLGVRQGYIQGKGMTYSPKLPLLDSCFILLNVKKIAQSQAYRDGLLFHSSCDHFRSWSFSESFDFLLNIEEFFKPEDIHIYQAETELMNQHGQPSPLDENAFAYCPHHAFVTLPQQLSRSELSVLTRLVQFNQTRQEPHALAHCFNRSFFYQVSRLPRLVKNLFFNKSFETQKTYSDNT